MEDRKEWEEGKEGAGREKEEPDRWRERNSERGPVFSDL